MWLVVQMTWRPPALRRVSARRMVFVSVRYRWVWLASHRCPGERDYPLQNLKVSKVNVKDIFTVIIIY